MAVTALLLVLQKPDSVQQAGFLLSYGAVLGLTLFLPVFQTEAEYRIQKILQEKLLPGIGILLVTLPVQLWFFYELPVYAMLLNLLVIPLMSVLLPVAIFAYLLRFPLLLQIPGIHSDILQMAVHKGGRSARRYAGFRKTTYLADDCLLSASVFFTGAFIS